MDEYLDDGGWEGEAKEEWRKEFLDNIDTSKDGFLDRDEVAGAFFLFEWIVKHFISHYTYQSLYDLLMSFYSN